MSEFITTARVESLRAFAVIVSECPHCTGCAEAAQVTLEKDRFLEARQVEAKRLASEDLKLAARERGQVIT